MKYLPLLALFLIGCGTTPKTYSPPSNAKLEASTGRLSRAVEQSHQSARKAQASVNKATNLAKHAQSEVAKIKNVPAAVTNELAGLQAQLHEAQQFQNELEKQLNEADQAKAQVGADKLQYYANAQKLADDATKERNLRIKSEQSLHWYRSHFLLTWGLLILGVILSGVFFIAKLAGKWTFP